jgi:hypothetical protein
MIDRENRDRLVDAINRYLDEAITAFEFDDQIHDIRSATDDRTLQRVVDTLWFYYDDCEDHKVVLTKEAWDHFQRLALLLKSDMHVKVVVRRKWSVRQIIAGLALGLFGVCVARLGFGRHLLVVAVPFGVVSMLLSYWHHRAFPTSRESILTPFSSVSEILGIRRKVSGFAKRKYPSRLTSRTIRSPLMATAVMLQTASTWLFLSPLVLLFQMLPDTDTIETCVADEPLPPAM